MAVNSSEQDVLRRLRALLRQGPSGAYPLPEGETPACWRERAMGALEVLSEGSGNAEHGTRADLFRHLGTVATEPLGGGLEEAPGRVHLVGEILRNLADPWRINQGAKGTCAVTVVETWLADREPAEYARILAGLLSQRGEVEMRNGDVLRRDEDEMRSDANVARRSPVSRVFQAASMEYAYPELDYRNGADAFYEPATRDPVREGESDEGSSSGEAAASTGLGLQAFDHLLEGISGERWDTLSDQQSRVAGVLLNLGLDTTGVPDLHRDGRAILVRSLAQGDSVFVTLDSGLVEPPQWKRAGNGSSLEVPNFARLPHKVRAFGLEEQGRRVLFEDPLDPSEPWIQGGRTRLEDRQGRCSMALEDFCRLTVEMSYLPRHWSVEAESADHSPGGPQ